MDPSASLTGMAMPGAPAKVRSARAVLLALDDAGSIEGDGAQTSIDALAMGPR